MKRNRQNSETESCYTVKKDRNCRCLVNMERKYGLSISLAKDLS